MLLYTEIIDVCSENHTHDKNTLRGQHEEFLGAFTYSRKAPFNFVMSTHRSVCESAHFSKRISASSTARIYVKFDIGNFYENLSRKPYRAKISTALHEDRTKFYWCRRQ